MDISIDLLKVDNADAIIIWMKDNNNNFVIVIDGGNKDDGEKIINHLNAYILKPAGKTSPDMIISTHPDKDHLGGLIEVVKHYGNGISLVLVHDPSKHMGQKYFDLKKSVQSRVRENGFDFILRSLQNLDDFISLVDHHKIKRYEPFVDAINFSPYPILILGPTQKYYEDLLSGFADLDKFLTSEAKEEYESSLEGDETSLALIYEEMRAKDSPCPVVDEVNTTSAENNSSVILEITVSENKYIFSGDAGVEALNHAHNLRDLRSVYWLKVPHHGSRRNLSSELIGIMKPQISYVSAKGDKKHPRLALVNCLKKAGSNVYSTHKNGSLWHHRGEFPTRSDYTTAEAL